MATALDRPPVSSPVAGSSSKWQRGLACLATFCVAPFGWFLPQRFFECTSEERLEKGLVLILPGIEGRSFLNMAILHGLVDSGLPYAMEVVDWTTGNKFLTLYHLRAWKRNLRIARQLAQRIVEYQTEYPGRPVWIVGHSGGGGMALLTAEALPDSHRLTGLVLLAAAVSPRFDLGKALGKVERGIWSFHSWLDWLFVGVGTTVFGTMDGWHMPAAGMIGFARRPNADDRTPRFTDDTAPVFQQTAYHPRMAADFHLGGHFGCVHRVFVSERVARVISSNAD
jgi:pimeloyl-ACP methyl ester carboxylesterase